MSSSQFAEWMAYYQAEPFGEFREELRNGTACALLANLERDREKQPDPFSALDFMHFTERPEQQEVEQTPEQIAARMRTELFKVT